ncbi:cell division control protein 6 homolog [Acipenser ruthenus]|uniref:cell division control protein 6 homolog n=1 Tax=Acipenser ruthenus TaxID=7906 RepID=UPI001560C9EC|nr:cell division control protein 6 homolog [Acipenser ruthenus]
MPSTRSGSQTTISYPKKKSSRLASKPQNDTPKSENTRKVTLVSVAASPNKSEVLPLSPRKRTGDENLCNLPRSLLGSPPKQCCKENSVLSTPLSPRTPSKLNFDEARLRWGLTLSPLKRVPLSEVGSPGGAACDLGSPKSTPLVEPLSPTRSPYRRAQETPTSSPRGTPKEKAAPVVRLFTQEGSCYQQTKQALNTAIPERLLSREEETAAIRAFLSERVGGQRAGSLYISGAPGTGKTACLRRILQDCKEELRGSQQIFVNCMSLRSSHCIFPVLAERLQGAGRSRSGGKDIGKRLERLLTGPGPMVLLVLDEMDQLDSKAQDVLYTIFEWPWLDSSRLCLIGIANALDLTDRILPRLQARPHCKPQLLNFAPYSREQLIAIVQDRLAKVSGEQVLDGAAVQFCARKVSAVSGDARKALDVCRRAVEIVESDVRKQTVLKPTTECVSPVKSPPVPRKVSLLHVSRVISEVYGDRMVRGGEGDDSDSFPLQQKLLVCSLLLLTRKARSREVTLGKLHEAYSRVCLQQQVGAVGQAECLSLSSLLESRGIFGLKKAKEARLTKVALKIEEKDIEHALKDKALTGTILTRGLI